MSSNCGDGIYHHPHRRATSLTHLASPRRAIPFDLTTTDRRSSPSPSCCTETRLLFPRKASGTRPVRLRHPIETDGQILHARLRFRLGPDYDFNIFLAWSFISAVARFQLCRRHLLDQSDLWRLRNCRPKFECEPFPFACLLVLRCARPPTHDCCNTTTQLISTRGHDIGSLDELGAEDIAAPWHTPLPLLPLGESSLSPPCPSRAAPSCPRAGCSRGAHRAASLDFGIFAQATEATWGGNGMHGFCSHTLPHSTTETSDTTDRLSAGTQSVASTSATVLPAARQTMPPLQPHGKRG